MKKTIANIFMTVITLISVTGCGGSESKIATKPLNEITQAVIDCGIQFPEMVDVNEDNFQFKYGLTADDYTEYSVWWAGSGGDADEVCIVKAKDNKADSVKSAVEKRLEDQKIVFKDYVPAQYDKLCNTKVKTEGDYIYWVCTNDNSKAEDVILSYFE